jgi:hypothetical protein
MFWFPVTRTRFAIWNSTRRLQKLDKIERQTVEVFNKVAEKLADNDEYLPLHIRLEYALKCTVMYKQKTERALAMQKNFLKQLLKLPMRQRLAALWFS